MLQRLYAGLDHSARNRSAWPAAWALPEDRATAADSRARVRAGQANIKRRSLLSGHEGFTTFSFQADWAMERPGYVFGYLRRRFDEATVNQVGRMRLTNDQKGAVFDLPSELVDDFVAKCVAAPLRLLARLLVPRL